MNWTMVGQRHGKKVYNWAVLFCMASFVFLASVTFWMLAELIQTIGNNRPWTDNFAYVFHWNNISNWLMKSSGGPIGAVLGMVIYHIRKHPEDLPPLD
jgi:hypothetical protein